MEWEETYIDKEPTTPVLTEEEKLEGVATLVLASLALVFMFLFTLIIF